jgi:hypothetical protein
MRLSETMGSKSKGTEYEEHSPAWTNTPGSIRSIDTYQRPIAALLNGRPVRLLAAGDVVGLSPSQMFVDEQGQIDWASNSDFVVTDDNVVPQSQQQRSQLYNRSQQQQQQQR